MRHVLAQWLGVGLFSACLGIAGGGRAVACDAGEKDSQGIPAGHRTPAVEKIEMVLDEPTELEFIEVPLTDVVCYLNTRHGIAIQIDKRCLDEAALPPDTRITRNLKGVTLRSALSLTLRELPIPLSFVVVDEVLLITTKAQADTMLSIRVYPVCDLLQPMADDEAKPDFEPLISVIQAAVAPQSWMEVGGPATAHALPSTESIVIRQTQDAHWEIAGLLAALREARATQAKASNK
ncbi:MAG TPA: hypothetical protein VHZ24_04315 [Pirellulales bacterium]|jgi:hypothetical protein|nr:hypothetical protein [Pirellulales bacterium]